MSEQPLDEERKYPVKQSAALAGGTLAAMSILDVAAHLGPTGLLVGGMAAYIAWRHGPEILGQVRGVLPLPERTEQDQSEDADQTETEPKAKGRTFADWALGRKPVQTEQELENRASDPSSEEEDQSRKAETAPLTELQDLQALLKTLPKSCALSQVIPNNWHPTSEQIFLGFLADGTPIFIPAAKLCHVALAGATDGGKSSIMRLLMAQLCHVGCKVLLLNPHYTRYDRNSDEDWTPFEQYLMRDPMECKDFKTIEACLKHAATTLLPKRIEKHARGQNVGTPYFIVIDELPAIIDEIPDAPKYLSKLLRQGRKFGLFLISASQDFLVKTIDPKGNGSGVRECYRTAFYVGGDTTTGKTLLNIQSVKEIPEEILGKGAVMLRGASSSVKRAALVRVPFLDNNSLYYLLGPSTYRPESEDLETDDEDELFGREARRLSPTIHQEVVPTEAATARPTLYTIPRAPEKPKMQADEEEVDPADMAKAFVLFQTGATSVRTLTQAAKTAGYGWSNGYCRRLLKAMKRYGLIQVHEVDVM